MAVYKKFGTGRKNGDVNISIEFTPPAGKSKGKMNLYVIERENAQNVKKIWEIDLAVNTVQLRIVDKTGALRVDASAPNDFKGYATELYSVKSKNFDAKVLPKYSGTGMEAFIGIEDGRNYQGSDTQARDARTVTLDDISEKSEKILRLWYNAAANELVLGVKNTAVATKQLRPDSVGEICWGSDFSNCFSAK